VGRIGKAETTIFGKWCIEKFGKVNGDVIYKFYNSGIIRFDDNSELKKSGLHKTTRDKILFKIKNLVYLTETKQVPIRILLAAIKFTTEQYESGSLISEFRSVSAFKNFVLNFSEDKKEKKIETQKQDNIQREALHKTIVETKIIFPIMNKKISSKFDDEIEKHWHLTDWNYKCECGEIVNFLTKECPKCKSILDFKNVVTVQDFETIKGSY
jgi:hypothetical protein